MYNLHLSAEQLEIRDTVRDFVAQEIKPAAIRPARLEPRPSRCCSNALDQASRIGLRTLSLSEDAGGAGADTLTCCIVIEELAAGDPDVAAVLAQTSTLARPAVRPGDERSPARALPAGLPGGRPLSSGVRRAGAGRRYHARHQLSSAAGRTSSHSDHRGARGRCVDHQRREEPRRQCAAREAVRGHGRDRRWRRTAFLVPRDAPD